MIIIKNVLSTIKFFQHKLSQTAVSMAMTVLKRKSDKLIYDRIYTKSSSEFHVNYGYS